jgi:hypothetical protein
VVQMATVLHFYRGYKAERCYNTESSHRDVTTRLEVNNNLMRIRDKEGNILHLFNNLLPTFWYNFTTYNKYLNINEEIVRTLLQCCCTRCWWRVSVAASWSHLVLIYIFIYL